MATRLHSEKQGRDMDLEKLILPLAIMLLFFVMLIASLSQIDRGGMPTSTADTPRKYPNPELKAL